MHVKEPQVVEIPGALHSASLIFISWFWDVKSQILLSYYIVLPVKQRALSVRVKLTTLMKLLDGVDDFCTVNIRFEIKAGGLPRIYL